MKITFVLPARDLSGGVKVVATYAERLQERGHEVLILAPPPHSPSLRERARALVRERRWLTPGGSHLDGRRVSLDVLGRRRPLSDDDIPDSDAIIATWWETAEWIWPLSRRKGAKVYFLQHYEAWYGHADRVDATWRLPMHRIVVSRWLERLGRDRFGISDLTYVPNAADEAFFRVPARGKQPRPTVGLMYSGSSYKATDVALEAIAIARRDVPDLRVRCFGAESPSARLPLPGDAIFELRPSQDRIPAIYGACDAWLFASRSEGFGLPILEAMACRTPVIAAPAGAAPELVLPGGGVLLPSSDARSMARAIVELCALDDPSWRTRSEMARATARHFSWDRSVREFEAALEKAAALCGGHEAHGARP